ncbi:MAG: HAD family hydrolase [Candidatus Bathyarchaeota archaeon]|nr:MAG: HAD family hydrolase [Candidatus Bathyarchaeota archaeon]
MVIRAVILDFGGTLASGQIDWHEYHVAMHGLLKGLGHSVELRRMRRAISVSLEELARVRARGRERTFEEVYGSALKSLGIYPDDDTLGMIHSLFKKHFVSIFYPCTEAVLSALAERFKLALISNTMSDQPRELLEKTGLVSLFEVVVCSRDLGVRKPNPEIFEYVLGRLDVDPREAVHVGDSVEADMEGALNTGILPIWIKTPDEKPWAGYAISNICELPELLDKITEDKGFPVPHEN